VHLLTYLLTYTVGSGSIKPAISSQTVEDRAKVTINGITAHIKSYTGFRLLRKYVILNDF